MSIVRRRLSIVICAIGSVLVGGCTQPNPPPPKLMPGVEAGRGLLTRSTFATCSIGEVTDMAVDSLTGYIEIAGAGGAATISRSGAVKTLFTFSMPHERVSVVPLGWWSGKYEYLTNDTWAAPATLVDAAGRTLWTAPNSDGVDDSCAADILADGNPEIIVSYNGSGGVSAFNGGTTPIWNVPDGNCWHVAAFRDGPLGPWRIVHSDAAGLITVRDASGNVMSQSHAPDYFYSFSLCHYKSPLSPTRILFNTDATSYVLKMSGDVVATLKTPHVSLFDHMVGCTFRPKAGKGYFFAVLGVPRANSSLDSALSVFDASGKLVYEVVLPETCGSILALPGKTSSAPDTLLIGGTSHIWRYR